MDSNFPAAKPQVLKERKAHPGWKNVWEANAKRRAAKELRLKKEEAYRNMVGSVRELRRKKREFNRIMRPGVRDHTLSNSRYELIHCVVDELLPKFGEDIRFNIIERGL